MNRITKAILIIILLPVLFTAVLFFVSEKLQPDEFTIYSDTPERTAFFDTDKDYYFKGQFRCYPGKMLTTEEVNSGSESYVTTDNYAYLTNDDCMVDDYYMATLVYFFKVPENSDLSIWIPAEFCEYRIYSNGIYEGGTDTFMSEYPPYPSPDIYDLHSSESGEYELVINVITPANFGASNSSIILFGDREYLTSAFTLSKHVSMYFFCMLIFIVVFCLIQTFAFSNDRMLLAFLCFALTSLMSIAFTDDVPIMQFIPGLPYQLGVILKSLSTPLYLICLVNMARNMFPDYFPRRMAEAFIILQIIPFVSLLCFEQVKVLVRLSAAVTIIPYAICLYVFIFAFERREPYALSYGIATLFVETSVLVNYATADMAVPAKFSYAFGIAAFTIIEVVVLAKRYAKQYDQELFVENELSTQLENMQASENAFLNAQMKPHFLYNTLNTIADLCVTDPPKAKHLISLLTDYLKLVLSLDNMEKTVPIKRELELAESYASIENERFPSITFNNDYPIKMPNIELPPITIQPLIENAIKHGVRKSDKSGIITLRIEEDRDTVIISVSDNGAGMDEATIAKLFEMPKENKSIGIYNIDKRLKNQYGHGLTVESTPGLGTSVRFFVPKS